MGLTGQRFDAVVIGGGFYGCAVALELCQLGKRVALLEKGADLMQRASYINQARIHQGYHYPRSVLTALRSRVNFDQFTHEYSPCVFSEFDMYYAIGRIASKVNAEQFQQFCHRVGAPIRKAQKTIGSLFNSSLIEEVFQVREYAFDAIKLKELMQTSLSSAEIEVTLNSDVSRIRADPGGLRIEFTGPEGNCELGSNYVFNCTYSEINRILESSTFPMIPLKHELAEMVLVQMPKELDKMGFTVMDGPFFSVMPFPARGLHSLSHVRYTPHHYWQDEQDKPYMDAYRHSRVNAASSHAVHMQKDAQRYLPALADCQYVESLWEVKTVLPQSEVDDSRPILFQRNEQVPKLISIMGGKIDNIFDIREQLQYLFGIEENNKLRTANHEYE